MNKLKKNIVYQVLYQILTIATPLITTPYISRKLGADNLGVYAYAISVVSYFQIFTQLGISNHGCRAIAEVKDDYEKRSYVFWNLYIIQVVCSLITILTFGVFVLLCNIEYKRIFVIQGGILFAYLLDINWYYYGMDRFKLTAIRGIVVKVLIVLAIWIFVRDKDDILVYTFIMVLYYILPALTLWFKVFGMVKLPKIDLSFIKANIKPIIILAIPILASNLYHTMDKTMLGFMSTYSELGCYYNSEKVINIPMNVFSGISTVMMSYLSHVKENNGILNKSFELFFALAVAMSLGIGMVSDEFVIAFFGTGYEECTVLIKLFVPIMFVKVISMFSRMQIIVPRHSDKIYVWAVICGTCVNLVMNNLLIEKMGAIGAVIATFFAEIIVCIIQCINTFKYFNYIKAFKDNFSYTIFGLLMCIVISVIKKVKLHTNILRMLIIEIITGGGVYVALCIARYLVMKKNLKTV